ncbi:MAG: hypothetical protein JO036_13460 [Candidatus Eremiobacteraeota bacterium]|nr:hypothetical protein [Candidatus Eremiobacteraeota bacterium]
MSQSEISGGTPAWPSLEQQLVESRVVHGSALEQLVKDNQDFSMLWPREANDQLRIPLWLRVYWRKNHPENTFPEHSASLGYPMALLDLYEWMVAHQDLKRVEQVPPKPAAPGTPGKP